MYYIVKLIDKKEYIIINIDKTTDRTYYDLKLQVEDIKGQFGRKDYATIWTDYHNNKITNKQLRYRLNI